MNPLLRKAFLPAVAVLLAGCASTEYSRLYGDRYHQTATDTYPVMVIRVDERSTSARMPVQVEPGKHVVAVQAYPTKTQRFGEVRTIELDVAPCTRYYLVAVKQNALAADFAVKVDYAEPIAGCTPPKG